MGWEILPPIYDRNTSEYVETKLINLEQQLSEAKEKIVEIDTENGELKRKLKEAREEIERLRKIAESALEGLYNGYEPNNQSARYKKLKAALEASDEG